MFNVYYAGLNLQVEVQTVRRTLSTETGDVVVVDVTDPLKHTSVCFEITKSVLDAAEKIREMLFAHQEHQDLIHNQPATWLIAHPVAEDMQ